MYIFRQSTPRVYKESKTSVVILLVFSLGTYFPLLLFFFSVHVSAPYKGTDNIWTWLAVWYLAAQRRSLYTGLMIFQCCVGCLQSKYLCCIWCRSGVLRQFHPLALAFAHWCWCWVEIHFYYGVEFRFGNTCHEAQVWTALSIDGLENGFFGSYLV